MAKRVNINIGDVFLIQLESGLFGAGRIMKSDEQTILVELYRMKLLDSKELFSYEDIMKEEQPLLMRWCYNSFIKNGEWEIVDHKAVCSFEMPTFVQIDVLSKILYLVKGTDDCFGESTGIAVTKEEARNYEISGIADPYAVINSYQRRLKENNLMK